MLKGTVPKLVVKTMRELLSDEVEHFMMPSVWQDLTLGEAGAKELHEFAPGGEEVNFVSTWEIMSHFSMKIISATHVNVAENHKVTSTSRGVLNTVWVYVGLRAFVC